MKTRLIIAVIVSVIMTFWAGSEEIDVEEFLTRIGVEQQVEIYPDLLSLYVYYDPNIAVAYNNIAYQEEVEEIIQRRIYETDYFAYVVEGFKSRFDEKRVTSYYHWVVSPVGEKITQMEMGVSNLNSAFEILEYGGYLEQNPPEDERVRLVQKIINIAGGQDKASSAIDEIRKGLYTGLQETVGNETPTVRFGIGEEQQTTNEMLLTTFLFTYREATNEELQEYVTVLEDQDTRWILDVLHTIYVEMVNTLCREIAIETGPYFRKASSEILSQMEKLDFESYRLSHNEFDVFFPTEPEKMVQEIPTTGESLDITIWQVIFDDLGANFLVSFNRYPKELVETQSAYTLLDNAVYGMLGDDKILISNDRISLNGTPGYDIRAFTHNGMLTVRNTVYLAGDRLFQVIFYGPTYIADQQKIKDFFRSFRIK